jgi:hypothetical protein
VLEHSAQFLSNIHDEHKSLKLRLETVAKNIETTKTVNKDVKDRLIDVETQSLRQNLLFFAIDEQPDNTDMETNRPGDDMGGVTGGETGIRGVQREIHQHSLKHIISFSHTDLRNSPSANFLIIPFEIFQEHTLRALFTLPFSLISLSADPYSFHNVPFTNSLSPTM